MVLVITIYVASVLICWTTMVGVSIVNKTDNLLDFQMGLIPVFNVGISALLFIIILLKITENGDKQC